MSAWTSSMLSLLRVVSGFLITMHGSQKLLAFPAAMPGNPAELPTLMLAAGIVELVGGVMLILGLLTRPAAFFLSGEMAVAYFKGHSPQGFWPLLNGGELAVLYCFVFLFLTVAGGGRYSLDALLRPRTVREQPVEVRHRRDLAA